MRDLAIVVAVALGAWFLVEWLTASEEMADELVTGTGATATVVVNSSADSGPATNGWQTVVSSGGAAMTKLRQFANAIYDFEDPNKNQVATRNNNPGNLKFAKQPGATGADARGFAVFPDLETGYTALENQLKLDAGRGLTVAQLFNKWLGSSNVNVPVNNNEGNSVSYAATIAGKVGATVHDTLSSIFGG